MGRLSHMIGTSDLLSSAAARHVCVARPAVAEEFLPASRSQSIVGTATSHSRGDAARRARLDAMG